MKTCDICKKPTVYLEDLDYCSVCVDCLGEIEDVEYSDWLEFFPDQKDEQPEN